MLVQLQFPYFLYFYSLVSQCTQFFPQSAFLHGIMDGHNHFNVNIAYKFTTVKKSPDSIQPIHYSQVLLSNLFIQSSCCSYRKSIHLDEYRFFLLYYLYLSLAYYEVYSQSSRIQVGMNAEIFCMKWLIISFTRYIPFSTLQRNLNAVLLSPT